MSARYYLALSVFVVAVQCTAAEMDASLRAAAEHAILALKPSGEATYSGVNPNQDLDLQFDAGGARLHHRLGTAAFRLTGYGYGTKLLPAAPVQPEANGTRVEYRRAGLVEWYVNQASGLEQGFTLQDRPATNSEGPLVLALAVEGELQPKLAGRGERLELQQSSGRPVLRYSGLHCQDTRGRTVQAWMEVQGREVRLLVNDREAEYPLVVDPVFTQEAELKPGDLKSTDNFGWSVSVSDNTAVIGAPYQQEGGNASQGAAYVFVRNGASWALQQKLVASDGTANDRFGSSVSIAASTVMVGAPGNGAGAVYAFRGGNTGWTEQKKLVAAEGATGDAFGSSVMIADSRVVIGAPNKKIGSNTQQGAAYIFVGFVEWSEQAQLLAPAGASNSFFGQSVILDIGASIAVIGAPGANSVYVFSNDQFGPAPASWPFQQTLTAPGAAMLGASVASVRGTILVGTGAVQGAAYIFAKNGAVPSVWELRQTLLPPPGDHAFAFGSSVSISRNLAVVASLSQLNGSNTSTGTVYEYTLRQGSTQWTLQQTISPSNPADGVGFVYSVWLDNGYVDGGTLVVGAALKSSAMGSAYAFAHGPDLLILKTHGGFNFSQGEKGASYEIGVFNVGRLDTTGTVTVTDTLPAGLVATSIHSTSQEWTCTLATLSCFRNYPASGGGVGSSIYVTVDVDPNAPASVTNQASVSNASDVDLSNNIATDVTIINPIVNVSNKVKVTQTGLTRNRATGVWSGTMTMTNTSSSPISGPIQVVLHNLPGGVTMLYAALRNGDPYVTASPGTLAPGQSANMTILFLNPNNVFISYTTEVDSGVF